MMDDDGRIGLLFCIIIKLQKKSYRTVLHSSAVAPVQSLKLERKAPRSLTQKLKIAIVTFL